MSIQNPCPQFLLGFALVNAYLPGIDGAAIPTGWLFLLVVIPFCMVEVRITEAHIVGALFTLYCIISLLWTPNLNIGFSYLLRVIIIGAVFCMASGLRNIRWLIIGLTIGLIPSDILSYLQLVYGVKPLFSINADVAGVFVNPNIYCEFSAAVLLALLYCRLFWLIPITLPGIFLVHSRGALVGLFLGAMLWIYQQSKTACYALSASIITIAAVYYSDHFAFSSVNERFSMWLDAWNGLKLFGNGIGSFELMYPYYATHIDTSFARPKFLHNDLYNFVFEIGIGTIFLVWFTVIIYRIAPHARFVLLGIGLMAMFSYSLNVSVIAFLWALFAGFASINMPSIRAVGDSRGSYLFKGFTAG